MRHFFVPIFKLWTLVRVPLPRSSVRTGSSCPSGVCPHWMASFRPLTEVNLLLMGILGWLMRMRHIFFDNEVSNRKRLQCTTSNAHYGLTELQVHTECKPVAEPCECRDHPIWKLAAGAELTSIQSSLPTQP